MSEDTTNIEDKNMEDTDFWKREADLRASAPQIDPGEEFWRTFPTSEIEVNDSDWLCWYYRLAPYAVDMGIPLTRAAARADGSPWLRVVCSDPPSEEYDVSVADEKDQADAELRYGAMTRIRLLEAHAEEIRNPVTREAGLARVREAATAAGLG